MNFWVLGEDNLTPLEAAKIPNLDKITKSGLTGIHDPVQTNLAWGSDTAHMSLFDLDPFQLYDGRGAFETMGAGVNMEFNEIAFKWNFALIDDETDIVLKRRADREFSWGISLWDEINGLRINEFLPQELKSVNYNVIWEYATEHRWGIKISGPNLVTTISELDPLKDNRKISKWVPLEDTIESQITAKVVQATSDAIREWLSNHPINIERKNQGLTYTNVILLRGCGKRFEASPFEHTHGLKSFMIAPTAIIKGIGMHLDFDIYDVQGATGSYDSNYHNKLESAENLLQNEGYDFGFVHIKAIDDAGHDKNRELKIEMLEKVDEAIGKSIERLGWNSQQHHFIMWITGDHTTPVSLGDHTHEPVPFIISTAFATYNASNIPINEEDVTFYEENDFIMHSMRDGVEKFDEISCSYGALGRFQLKQSMNIVKGMKAKIEEILQYFYNHSNENSMEKLHEDIKDHGQNYLFTSLGSPIKSWSSKDIGKDSQSELERIK